MSVRCNTFIRHVLQWKRKTKNVAWLFILFLFIYFLSQLYNIYCELRGTLKTMLSYISGLRILSLPHYLWTSCSTWKTTRYDCNGVQHVVWHVSLPSHSRFMITWSDTVTIWKDMSELYILCIVLSNSGWSGSQLSLKLKLDCHSVLLHLFSQSASFLFKRLLCIFVLGSKKSVVTDVTIPQTVVAVMRTS